MRDEWTELADLLTNMIEKYIDVLDIDNLPDVEEVVDSQSIDVSEVET